MSARELEPCTWFLHERAHARVFPAYVFQSMNDYFDRAELGKGREKVPPEAEKSLAVLEISEGLQRSVLLKVHATTLDFSVELPVAVVEIL